MTMSTREAGGEAIGETNMAKALTGWGDPVPAWVRMLALACDRTNQRHVGDQIGLNSATVSKIIRNVYPGDLAECAEKVMTRLGQAEVDCPAMGTMPLASCRRYRQRQGAPVNHLQRLFAAHCPTCCHNPERILP